MYDLPIPSIYNLAYKSLPTYFTASATLSTNGHGHVDDDDADTDDVCDAPIGFLTSVTSSTKPSPD